MKMSGEEGADERQDVKPEENAEGISERPKEPEDSAVLKNSPAAEMKSPAGNTLPTIPGKLIPVTTSNNVFVGTILKAVVKGQENQKVLLPIKTKDGSLTRILLPRTQTTAITTSTTSTTSPSLSVLLPQSSCRQLSKSYIVTPTTQQSLIKPSQPISLLSKNTIIIDQSNPSKIFSPNIIRQKGAEGQTIVANSMIKPFNILQAKKLIASTTGSTTFSLLAPKDSETSNTTTISLIPSKESEAPPPKEPETEETNENDKTDSDSSQKTELKPSQEKKDDLAADEAMPHSSSSEEFDAKEKAESPKPKVNGHIEKRINGLGNSAKPSIRTRKRKSPFLVKGAPPIKNFANQQENLKLLPGAEDFDPYKTVEWDATGLGSLPGCNIRMVLNELGMLEVLNDSDDNKKNDVSNNKEEKNKSEEIYCCVACSCYGLISEFYNENYCSIACKDKIISEQQALCNKPEDVLPPEPKKKKLKNKSDEDEKVVQNGKTRPQENHKSEVIDVDEDSSNSDTVPLRPSIQRKSFEMAKVKRIKVPMKAKVRMESLLPPRPINRNIKASLKPINDDDTKDFKKKMFNVAQDLDPLEFVEVKMDARMKEEKKAFPWGHYLSTSATKPTWIKLFSDPIPECSNKFLPNTYLEAIDMEHQSYFCVVKIVEVKGFRLKLNFDGYPSVYDFWVNADSPNIFPCGFCPQHGIKLHPPLSYVNKEFKWSEFLESTNSKPARSECFPKLKIFTGSTNLFKVGMKIEAVDKKNTHLVCVATVAGVIEERILVHFDSWSDMYDYWVHISSPYIHPIGWCKKNNHELTPPNGYGTLSFSWDMYLKKTGAIPAPAKAFCLRPSLEFKKGTKLEAVDKRSPHLLRVATVLSVLPYQIKIRFDGFPEHFGYWVDDDSPDIHPIGWGAKTGHSVQPPPMQDTILKSACSTPHCVGDGHFRHLSNKHSDVADCPYSNNNLTKDRQLPSRIDYMNQIASSNEPINIDLENEKFVKELLKADEDEPKHKKKQWQFLKINADMNKRIRIHEGNIEEKPSFKSGISRRNSAPTRFSLGTSHIVPANEILGDIKKEEEIVIKKEPQSSSDFKLSFWKWTTDQLCNHLNDLAPLCVDKLRNYGINGDGALMMTLNDYTTILNLEKEEAIEVYDKICSLKDLCNSDKARFVPDTEYEESL